MLDGLDGVDWTRLQHSYGHADDIPELLRALAGEDRAAAEQALTRLTGSIVHQGTTYSASAPAVPFLVQLLELDAVHDRAGIIWLLGTMVAHSNPRTRHLGAVRAAVTAEVDRFLRLLAHADPRVREAASYVLSQCPKRKRAIVPALRARFTVDEDAQARALLLAALAWLDPGTDLVAAALDEPNPPVLRAAAALIQARSSAPWTPQATAAVRAGWAGGEPLRPCPWWWHPLRDLLGWIGKRGPDCADVLAALLELPDAQTREAAAASATRAVAVYRSVRPALVPVLTRALTDPVLAVRATAAVGLRDAGAAARPATDALAELAASGPDEAAGEAVAALIELDDPRGLQLLPDRLAAGQPVSNALYVLAAAGVTFESTLYDAVLRRLDALSGTAPDSGQDAAPAGGAALAQDAAPAGESRRGTRREPRWVYSFPQEERDSLLRLVASWGPAAASAVPYLLALGEHGAAALGALGGAAGAALPQLRARVADGDATPAAPGRPGTVTHLHERLAIWGIAGDPAPALEGARTALAGILGHPDRASYQDAVALLQGLGEQGRSLLPTVRRAIATPTRGGTQEKGQVELARLVWQWTGDPQAVLPTVRRLLDAAVSNAGSPWASGADAPAELAAEIGDPSLVPLLGKLHGHGSTDTAAAVALWRLTGDEDGLAETLSRALTAVPPSRSWPQVTELLTALGPAAHPALPALRTVADSDRSPFTDIEVDFPTSRGVGHRDDQFLAAVRRAIAAIERPAAHVPGSLKNPSGPPL